MGKAVYASDLYSLGATCLHLLTQTSPLDLFDPHDHVWVWRRYLKQPVSDRLGHILDKLISQGINRRYQSAAAVLRDLQVGGRAALLPPRHLSAPNLSVPSPIQNEIQDQSQSRMQRPPANATPPPSPIAPPLSPQISASISSPGLTPISPRGAASVSAPGSQPSPPPSSTPTTRRKTPLPTWECVQKLHHPGKLLAIALSPTAPILASSSGTGIRLWDLQSGAPLRTLTGHIDVIPALAISPDGKLLVSGSADKTIRLWDLHTGQRLGSLTLHSNTVRAIALSPNGQFLVSSSLADPIIVWNFATGLEQHHLHGHGTRVDALAISPDGTLLASGGGDGTLRLWELANGSEVKLLSGHTQAIAALAWSADGKTLASGDGDGDVQLWSVPTRRLKRSLLGDRADDFATPPKARRINALTFSPSHKTLLIGSDTLKLWNPRTGAPLPPLDRTTAAIGAPISALVMSPFSLKGDQRQTLVTASFDGVIQVWQGNKV